jgi:DNA methylase
VEYAMCFKKTGRLEWANPLACGKPPKFGPGGAMSNRTTDGRRVRAFSAQTRRRANGERESVFAGRPIPEIANPGNLISTGNGGGGALGNSIAHENEAPFPEALAEHFLLSLCPPGGTVLDVFSGSGTTAAVAARTGRRGIGMDLRMSQCLLGRRRIADGLRPVSKLDPKKPIKPPSGQQSLFA